MFSAQHWRWLAVPTALLAALLAAPARAETVFVPIDEYTAAVTPVMAGPGFHAPFPPSHVYVTPPVSLPPWPASGWMPAWPAPYVAPPYAPVPRSYKFRERIKW